MEDGKRILLGRFFAGVAVFLFATIILWFFFLRTAQEDSSGQDQRKSASQKTVQKDGASQEKTPSVQGESAPGQGTTQATGTSSPPVPAQLADTGPGDAMLVLFFSAAILGGTSHHLYRKFNSRSL